MSARNVLESQQSVHAATAGRRAAGCWKLATGQALSLRPKSHGVLQIAQGQAWVTLRGALADLPGAAADHVLQPGEQLTVAPGQHVVMEAWSGSGCAESVAFRWDVQAAPALAQPASTAAASSAQRRQGEKDKGREGIMRASDKVRAPHAG